MLNNEKRVSSSINTRIYNEKYLSVLRILHYIDFKNNHISSLNRFLIIDSNGKYLIYFSKICWFPSSERKKYYSTCFCVFISTLHNIDY